MNKKTAAIYTGCFLLGLVIGNRIEGKEEYIEGYNDIARIVETEQEEAISNCRYEAGNTLYSSDDEVSVLTCLHRRGMYEDLIDDVNQAAMDALRDEDGL